MLERISTRTIDIQVLDILTVNALRQNEEKRSASFKKAEDIDVGFSYTEMYFVKACGKYYIVN